MIRRRSVGILILILMLCMPGVCAAGGSLTVTLPDGVSSGKVALAKTTLAWDTELEDEAVLEEAEALGYHSDEEVSVTDGTARFDDLDPGIYYVWQTEPSSGYENFRGFLVRIDSANTTVDASPKMKSTSIRSVVTVTQVSKNVSTGFDDDRLLWIGGAALSMLIAMALIRRQHRKQVGERS